MWNWILASLASLSAGPDAVAVEAPKAAAAVTVAYGAISTEGTRLAHRPGVGGDASGVFPSGNDRERGDSRVDDARGAPLSGSGIASGPRK